MTTITICFNWWSVRWNFPTKNPSCG